MSLRPPSVWKTNLITFVVTYSPETDKYEEEFDLKRTSPDDEPEPGRKPLDPLTNSEWFDEEVSNYGITEFLDMCNVLDEARQHGKIEVTGKLVSTRFGTDYGEEWDLEFAVKEIKPC